jgi:hypothetical protein
MELNFILVFCQSFIFGISHSSIFASIYSEFLFIIVTKGITGFIEINVHILDTVILPIFQSIGLFSIASSSFF